MSKSSRVRCSRSAATTRPAIKEPMQIGTNEENTMARRNTAEVDVPENETEEVATTTEGETTEKAPKAKKEPKRGELPEGFVTPIGLAKVLTEKGLHQNKDGETVEVKPQMVYSYINNASKEDPFPLQTVTDSIGAERKVVNLDEGVAWWERKNARVAERKANAAAKADAKAKRAADKATATEAEGESSDAGEVTEAE
jgi:hypothetical protein